MLALLIAAAVAAQTPTASPAPRTTPTSADVLGREIGMPALPAYDAKSHVSIPMRADVYAALSPEAKDAYARVSYDAITTNSQYRTCAKLTPEGINARVQARRAEHEPVMGSVAVEVYAACY